jgi:PPOX class probable F420-dependent enzyme
VGTVELTDDEIDLLLSGSIGHLATIEPDGTPHVTAVWTDTDGSAVLLNTDDWTVKHRNIANNPTVALSLVSRANDYVTLWLKGTATLQYDGAEAHVDQLAQRYLGEPVYPKKREGARRVIVRIEPTARLARTTKVPRPA